MLAHFHSTATLIAVGGVLVLCACGTATSSVASQGKDTLSLAGRDTSGSSAAMAKRASLDSVCVDAINGYRSTLSLAALKDWSDSLDCFDRQAALDDAGNVAHSNFGMCGEMAQNTCPDWTTDTTLAAESKTLKSCILQMWNEGPGTDYSAHGHYINMTNKSYTKVGCGLHLQGTAAWIDMDFR